MTLLDALIMTSLSVQAVVITRYIVKQHEMKYEMNRIARDLLDIARMHYILEAKCADIDIKTIRITTEHKVNEL